MINNYYKAFMPIAPEDLKEAVLEGSVVIVFYAELSTISDKFEKVVKKFEDKFANQITVYKINVDEHPDVADYFGVKSIPSIALYKDGKGVVKVEGIYDYNVYEQQILKII